MQNVLLLFNYSKVIIVYFLLYFSLLITRYDFLSKSHTEFGFSGTLVNSVWLSLIKSYRFLSPFPVGTSAWHYLEKSYREHENDILKCSVWLSLIKSYRLLNRHDLNRICHTYSYSSPSHIHTLHCCCSRLFQVFSVKLAGYSQSSVKHLLVTA